jgi:hypothetical protein
MLTQPAAIESVHRLEADSKFFRSLVIVCGHRPRDSSAIQSRRDEA